MRRRDFFKAGVRKVAEVGLNVVEARLNQRADNWFRPPFALNELAFLLSCTRCDDCVTACKYDVIFKLPPGLGIQVAGTPAMDLLNRGCHLCDDWPCVAACKAGSLKIPDSAGDAPPAVPRLAKARIEASACLPYFGPECGACASACPVPGAMLWDAKARPRIAADLCLGCGLCREVCIVADKAVKVWSQSDPGKTGNDL